MDEVLEMFEVWALSIQREKMNEDKRYCELEKKKEAAFQAFCAAYSEKVQWDCLGLLDMQNVLSEDEKFFLFRFGVRLRLELGRLKF